MAVLKITAQNFEQEVLQSDKPVLVDFYADWCGPCKMMAPVIEEIAEEADDIKVGKLNIDNEMEIAQKYGVMSIPTLIVFKNGEEVKRDLGAKPKKAVLDMLK
ncbi:MAG: thioredoxin [Ruminococcus sp.]|jgi:thioredoxin|uniref:Thioredoxin n=1 Tax=Schaedlerella arabinosiphila TaxID=2044587 RepID=N2AJ81_9FIRM|nr:thioredoxin [Schaedlerella arabinosiphila]MCI8722843.1 thioredoxin [Ruminococcus sp.]KAI4442712.1 Thioredoxin [Schaedlerella arabinosiphila]MCI9212288.1 thioredoxin [Ruminococcus sp.]NDO70406.1 thioredoxin [Schaedlerella arabinosiphila]RRK33056.1 thioredoxin [Schaedlerella arabinosiphila]